jgi:hypothetical protein
LTLMLCSRLNWDLFGMEDELLTIHEAWKFYLYFLLFTNFNEYLDLVFIGAGWHTTEDVIRTSSIGAPMILNWII